jgi:uncharacterized protein YceH (UPF0502 family)
LEGFLEELAERADGPLAMELPRQPGARENRWTHLLSGTPNLEETAVATTHSAEHGSDVTIGEIAALKANVARLEAEVTDLRHMVGKLCAELGIADKGQEDADR